MKSRYPNIIVAFLALLLTSCIPVRYNELYEIYNQSGTDLYCIMDHEISRSNKYPSSNTSDTIFVNDISTDSTCSYGSIRLLLYKGKLKRNYAEFTFFDEIFGQKILLYQGDSLITTWTQSDDTELETCNFFNYHRWEIEYEPYITGALSTITYRFYITQDDLDKLKATALEENN